MGRIFRNGVRAHMVNKGDGKCNVSRYNKKKNNKGN